MAWSLKSINPLQKIMGVKSIKPFKDGKSKNMAIQPNDFKKGYIKTHGQYNDNMFNYLSNKQVNEIDTAFKERQKTFKILDKYGLVNASESTTHPSKILKTQSSERVEKIQELKEKRLHGKSLEKDW